MDRSDIDMPPLIRSHSNLRLEFRTVVQHHNHDISWLRVFDQHVWLRGDYCTTRQFFTLHLSTILFKQETYSRNLDIEFLVSQNIAIGIIFATFDQEDW